MADDSWDVTTYMEFQSTLPAIGMRDYVLDDITPSQQSELNELLIVQKREDEMYLNRHPEIRAIIALVLRLVMKHRPRCNIHTFIAQYFTRPSGEIREEIDTYLEERKLIISPNSQYDICKPLTDSADQDAANALLANKPDMQSEQELVPIESMLSEIAQEELQGEELQDEAEYQAEMFVPIPFELLADAEMPEMPQGLTEYICAEIIQEMLDQIFGQSGGLLLNEIQEVDYTHHSHSQMSIGDDSPKHSQESRPSNATSGAKSSDSL